MQTMQTMRIFRKSLLLALLLVCLLAPGKSLAEEIRIIITTDVHGHLVEEPDKGRTGFARLLGYVNSLKNRGITTFLLDSGDAFSGSAFAQADRGRTVARAMGMMGYRVLTPGNHAFDHNEAENDPLYYSNTLLETVRQANPDAQSTAVNVSRHNKPAPGIQQEPVVIYNASADNPNGLRIIVAGVLTPYTGRRSLQNSIAGFDFGWREGERETKEVILAGLEKAVQPYSRPQDLVIVLSHVGQLPRDEGLSATDLAQVANVDFVADGHSHEAEAPRQVGTAMYGNGGRYLERFLEIAVAQDGAAVMSLKTMDDVARHMPDTAMETFLAESKKALGLEEVLFSLPGDHFADSGLRSRNTPLGRLICRSLMEAAQADFAVYNVGGIRAGLGRGPVTVGGVYDVLPFPDTLGRATFSGRQVASLFEQWFSRRGRGYPQFYGMRVYGHALEGGKVDILGILDGKGQPLDPDKEYSLAINSFMLRFLSEKPLDATDIGKTTPAVISLFRANPNIELESLYDNRTLFVFSDRGEAEKAWEEASRGK